MKETYKKILPIADWLPGYKKSFLKGDISAGLTVGVMLIPQGMAYAMIAGLPPVYGLYASIVPQIVYAFFGTSRHLSVAPAALDSLLVAAGVSVLAAEGSAAYVAFAIMLAFFAGLLQLLYGVFQLGFIANLLSKPVISGFTTAAAFIIGFSQLKHLLGLPVDGSRHALEVLWETFLNIQDTHLLTLIIGLSGILLILGAKRISPILPGSLIAVVMGILVVFLFDLHLLGVNILKDIPAGLPAFQLPDFSLGKFGELVPLALTISIVSFMEAFSISKAIQTKERNYKVKPNQELVALGAANFIGALFQSYLVTGGFSRSAVNHESGAKTQLSALFAAALIVITLLFLTPVFYYLPDAILASVIMVAVISLIDYPFAVYLLKTNRIEFLLFLATFLVTLVFGLVAGILAGIIFSVLIILYRIAYPHIAILGRLEDYFEFRNIKRFKNLKRWENLLLIRFDAPLLFVNIQYFKDFVEQEVKQNKAIEVVILEGGAISHIDATAMEGLGELKESLKEQNIRFFFAELVGPVRDKLRHSGLVKDMRHEVFLEMNEAINYVVNNEEPRYADEAFQTN